MRKQSLLSICLLPITIQAFAEDIDALASQRDQLQQEIELLRQTTQDNRDRLDTLQRLIEAARKQNSQLDQQLNHSLQNAAGDTRITPTPAPPAE